MTFSYQPKTSLGNPSIPLSSFHDVQSICSAVSLLRASCLPLCASTNHQLMFMYLQLLCVPQAAAISSAVVLQLVSVWIGINVAIGWMLGWMECWLASAIRYHRLGANTDSSGGRPTFAFSSCNLALPGASWTKYLILPDSAATCFHSHYLPKAFRQLFVKKISHLDQLPNPPAARNPNYWGSRCVTLT